MKLSEYAAKVGIIYQTAWKHYCQGLIPGAYQLAAGTIIVPEDVLQKPGKTGVDVAVYARVSSSENRDNLETQAERMTQFATARGYKVVRVVKEVGSGINDGRKQFLSLLSDENVDVIVGGAPRSSDALWVGLHPDPAGRIGQEGRGSQRS